MKKTAAAASRERYKQAFLIGLIMAAVMFLPFVIYDRGYFFFFGDFNVQQIPFYQLAHEAVRGGAVFWNEYTDLGVNFIGSYSFYLLGSPFFWLTLPFPTAAVPYLMAPLLCLKFAVITLTGYGFITRFVKNKDYALMGAVMYAFSGFSIYNIFFNHFHEAIAFFPLLLIALEEHLQNNRRGFFALAVFICALSNYFFFAGQVVFVIIYFIIRLAGGAYKLTWGKFISLALEAVAGVMLAAFLLLPSALAVLENPRVGNTFNGWNALFYSNEQRYGAILQTFFFPPDLPSRPNFFPDGNVKWASVAGWLPLAGMCGVFAFLRAKRGHFVKRIILTSLVFALVPILNSTFFLFNSSYYARWFYMPILFMALATVMAFEDDECDVMEGIRGAGVVTVLMAVAIGLMPVKGEDSYTIGLEDNPGRFWLYVGVAVLCVILMAILFRGYKKNPALPRYALVLTCVVSCAYGMTFIGLGKTHSYSTDYIIDTAIEARGTFSLPETESQFFRTDVYDGMDNQSMFWHMPTIQAFHSIVPASVMEFYPEVGVERAVGSRPETKYYALRPLLSVRWLFVNAEGDREFAMPGYRYYDTQNGYEIYENTNYIPMGFAYDSYVDETQFEGTPTLSRGNLLLHSVYLDWETADRNLDILTHADDAEISALTEEQYAADCAARKATSAHYFAFDRFGFTAGINLQQERLVFFSVPYDKGFTAYVNGQPAQIERANIGFMAVRVPAGENVIRFEYNTPGLVEGAVISLCALVVLGLYLLLIFLVRRKRGPQPPPDDGGGPGPDAPDDAPPAVGDQLALYIDDEMPSLSVEPQSTGDDAPEAPPDGEAKSVAPSFDEHPRADAQPAPRLQPPAVPLGVVANESERFALRSGRYHALSATQRFAAPRSPSAPPVAEAPAAAPVRDAAGRRGFATGGEQAPGSFSALSREAKKTAVLPVKKGFFPTEPDSVRPEAPPDGDTPKRVVGDRFKRMLANDEDFIMGPKEGFDTYNKPDDTQ